MTARKPPGVSFESWIDRQIREARERGEMDDLPGTGKPIPGLDRPHDELWWVREKLRRENVSVLPPALALRKEAETARETALDAPTEDDARRIIEDLNRKIVDANTKSAGGPATNLAPFDIDRIAATWRAAHAEAAQPEAAQPEAAQRDAADPEREEPDAAPPTGSHWWRRRFRR